MLLRVATLLTSSVIEGGAPLGSGGTATSNAADSMAQAATADAALGGMSWGFISVFYIIILGAAYMLLIRPQRKREKNMVAMQKSIGAGDNVLTSSGMYGQVVSVGEDVFVVEFGTNRGVRIPIRKSDIVDIKTPKLTPAPVTEIPETPVKLKKAEKESKKK